MPLSKQDGSFCPVLMVKACNGAVTFIYINGLSLKMVIYEKHLWEVPGKYIAAELEMTAKELKEHNQENISISGSMMLKCCIA